MEIALWIVSGLSFCCWAVAWLMCARFREVPPRAGGPADSEVSISIVIPARNEETNLGKLLGSLEGERDCLHEVIVVNDQSEDRTADIAREHGAIVVEGKPLPEGWLGKPWACQQGADASTGSWLLFLDADTEFSSSGLSRMKGLAESGGGVHSACPHHQVKAPYEQLSAFFNVIMILGMNAFTAKGAHAREIGLFGQVLLVSREDYELVEGHHRVKREVLENFHLARHFEAAGVRRNCWLGRGCIGMRMFPGGLGDLVAGWSKGAASGARNTPRGAMVGVSLWLSALFMAAGPVCFAPFVSSALAVSLVMMYLLCVLQVTYLFKKAGTFSVFAALLFPVGLIFYQAVFFRALRRAGSGGVVKWKGRDVS